MNTKTLFAIIAIIATPIGFYLFKFSDRPLSNDPNHWAQFGDYFGGVLNPILSAAAFILLLKTISQNDKALRQNDIALEQNSTELALTRAELKQSAQAQIKHAEIEQINLVDRRNTEAQHNYVFFIETLANELAEICERKFMKLNETHHETNINNLTSTLRRPSDLILLKPTHEHEIKTTNDQLLYLLSKLETLVVEIQSTRLLSTHPQKKTIIQHKLIQKGQYIHNLINTIKNLSTQGDYHHGQYEETPFISNFPEVQAALAKLESNMPDIS